MTFNSSRTHSNLLGARSIPEKHVDILSCNRPKRKKNSIRILIPFKLWHTKLSSYWFPPHSTLYDRQKSTINDDKSLASFDKRMPLNAAANHITHCLQPSPGGIMWIQNGSLTAPTRASPLVKVSILFLHVIDWLTLIHSLQLSPASKKNAQQGIRSFTIECCRPVE